jgi:hypothetical protein
MYPAQLWKSPFPATVPLSSDPSDRSVPAFLSRSPAAGRFRITFDSVVVLSRVTTHELSGQTSRETTVSG